MAQLDTVEHRKLSREDEGNTKNFSRVRKRAWFFTWNNAKLYQEKALEKWMAQMTQYYLYQVEKGSTEHLQGCIYFKNARSPKFQEELCSDIHWEYCRSWKSAIKYCSKRDTRVRGPYTNIPGLKFLKTVKDPLEGHTPYPWQQLVMDIVETEPNRRDIYWFYEGKGNTGKSSLGIHLKMKYKKNLIYCCGSSKDLACMIARRQEQRYDVDIAIWDIPRCRRNKVNFNFAETLKNGLIFSGKYESDDLLFNPPHIIIFSNFPPVTDNLSSDRWKIFKIVKGEAMPESIVNKFKLDIGNSI